MFRLIDSAAAARQTATVDSTKNKRAAAWRHWNTFLHTVGLSQTLHLESMDQFQKNIIISAFAQAVREGTFSKRSQDLLVEGTVNATVSYVAQAFRSNNRHDPRLDADGKTCHILQEQYRGYKNTDKGRKKQKAIPASVLRYMYTVALSPWDTATVHLLILDFFFCMRSCEFLSTRYAEESKRTKILHLKNFQFKKGRTFLSLTTSSLDALASSDIIIITFEFQKNDWRNHTVHMYSTDDNLLCPVRAGGRVVKRVLSIPGSTMNTKICTFMNSDGTISDINSAQVLPYIRTLIRAMGESNLGFTAEDTGLHGIRSGGAMAMFFANVSEVIIQRVGRWSSNAFLKYIREQVDTFTNGVSTKMLQNEHFQTIHATLPDSGQHQDIFNATKPTKKNKSDGPIFDTEHKITFSDKAHGAPPRDSN